LDDDFRPEVCLLAATRADAPPARARAVNEATDAEAKSARRVGAGDVIGRGALMTRRGRVPYAATRGGRGMIAQFPRESEKKKPCL